MDEVIQLIAKTYGIVGVLILSPLVALGYVWRHNVKQAEENSAMQKELGAALAKVQESRVADAKAISDKLLSVLEEQARLNQDFTNSMDQVLEFLTKLASSKRV